MRPVSGTAVVAAVGGMVAAVAGGLIWYKQRPQALPPALNNENGVMLLIPAGPFRHGPNREEGVAPAFYIDRIEVTNSAYVRFCNATGRQLPAGLPLDRPQDPVVNVTIEDAAAFAKWADKRLPDALEWEKAFGGAEGRRFPWGDQPDASRANVSDNASLTSHRLLPADSMPEGGSPYNILHMAGNAAELTRTTDAPEPGSRNLRYLVKGGSFEQPLSAAEAWNSRAVGSGYRASDLGFRCAKDPPRR